MLSLKRNLTLKFWGVRGSIPISDSSVLKYGGNTSCVEVFTEEPDAPVLIFDAGTGIINLGRELIKRKVKKINIFISHTHWDHIQGLPFFAPFYDTECKVTVYSRHRNEGKLENVVKSIMTEPYMPAVCNGWKAEVSFVEFAVNDSFSVENSDIFIETAGLNHPIVSTGYRINYHDKSIAYITDTAPFTHILFDERFISEAPDINKPLNDIASDELQKLEQGVIALCKKTDAVIYDTMFSEDEYNANPHWGHSTVLHAVEICKSAGAKKLIAFHHAPDHSDNYMDKMIKNYIENTDITSSIKFEAAIEGKSLVF